MKPFSLQTIAILLLVGGATNVAIAWALSLWAPVTQVPPIVFFSGPVGGFDAFGVTATACAVPINEVPKEVVFRLWAGWPIKSLRGERHDQTVSGIFASVSRPAPSVFVSAIPPPQFLHPLSERLLPLAPLWPGFLVNTLCYAVPIALLAFGPHLLRQLRRNRRALCRACGYPITPSAVCPECGTHSAARAVA